MSERKINPKREALKAMSTPLKALVKEGAYDSINKALVDIYAKQGYTNLKSFYAWQTEGRKVKKGEKAFLLWGSPKPIHTSQPGEPRPQPEPGQPNSEDEDTFFPVAYVFDITQTEPKP